MATTSSIRGLDARRGSHRLRPGSLGGMLLAGALLALSLGLAGCGNDNPREDGGTIRVDIGALQSQLGGSAGSGFTTSAAGLDETAATTSVKSLIIGAVVITFQNEPLTSDSNINSDQSDKLATDILNSINYFSIVDLPTASEFAEFKVPPPGAGNWQVMAAGTRDQILAFDDINNSGDQDEAIYYGFESVFRQTSGSTGPTVEIEMKRACFIKGPPKGCAAYDDGGHAIVTSTVTILDVLNSANGTAAAKTDSIGSSVGGQSFPISVTAGNQATVQTALDAFHPSSGDTVTVVVTHPDAAGEADCASVNHANYSLDDTACVGTFATSY